MGLPKTNGRAKDGTFIEGNSGGPGNPHAQQVARLRSVMLKCVTEKSMRNVVKKLIALAEGGDLKAIELLLNRTVGKPVEGPQIALQVNQNAGEQKTPEERRAMVASIVARFRDSAAVETSAEAG